MIKKGSKLIDQLSPNEKKEYLRERELKKLERSNADKVLRRFASQIKEIGFIRTKPTFFVRETNLIAEFIHVHKYSFGPYFRIHTCIRVLNDSRESIALTGPIEKDFKASEYKFEYESSIESVEVCANEMATFVKKESESWYQQWSDRNSLLQDNSPLHDQDKLYLKEAILGKSVKSNVLRSKKLLKIE